MPEGSGRRITKRLKELEGENARLKKLLELDKAMLRELSEGDF